MTFQDSKPEIDVPESKTCIVQKLYTCKMYVSGRSVFGRPAFDSILWLEGSVLAMAKCTRNVGSRTRSSQIQKLAWNKLKGKSLQLAFRWGKAVKDVHFLVFAENIDNIEYVNIYIYKCIYSVQNTQHLQGFWFGFQGCLDLGKRALLLEMISGTHTAWFALLCLVCLANLRVSECVGGSRISFEACGISF